MVCARWRFRPSRMFHGKILKTCLFTLFCVIANKTNDKKKVCMMSELPRAQLFAEFCKLAEAAAPNSPATLAAQGFFKELIMRTSKKDAQNAHLQKPSLRDSFVDAVADLTVHVTQSDIFGAQTYEDIKSRLPEQHQNPSKGVGQVLRRLEIQFGMREPVMGFGK